MVADEIGALPENVSGARIQRCGPWGAEGDVDNAFRRNGCGGGVAVELVTELRGVDGEEDFIEDDLPGVLLEGEDGEFGAVLRGGGEPDAVTDDDGG